jgi:hypothetical protein
LNLRLPSVLGAGFSRAEYLHEHLTNSRLALLDTGHFAWEDCAEQWGAISLDWIHAHSSEPAR